MLRGLLMNCTFYAALTLISTFSIRYPIKLFSELRGIEISCFATFSRKRPWQIDLASFFYQEVSWDNSQGLFLKLNRRQILVFEPSQPVFFHRRSRTKDILSRVQINSERRRNLILSYTPLNPPLRTFDAVWPLTCKWEMVRSWVSLWLGFAVSTDNQVSTSFDYL